MQLFHQGLRELLRINQHLSNHTIGFVTIERPLTKWFIRFTQAIPSYSVGLQLRREYRHFSMGLQALSLKDVDSIYVMEIYNQHLLALLPMLASTGKQVFLGIHGNQLFAQENKIKYWGFLYLQKFLEANPQFKVVLLELDDDYIRNDLKFSPASKIVIPHPIISEVTPKLQPKERLKEDDKIKIGIIGIIRQDKPINKILEKIRAYVTQHPQQIELVIGTPIKQKPEYLENCSDITFIDTTKDEDYLHALQQLDILVTDFDQERYYYRASGVISDAGSCGCYIIAPNYPVIQHQITWPIAIGSSYSNLDDLEQVIEAAIIHIREKGQDNHWIWREKRNAEYIAKLLFSQP
ncbi:glycosyltransferase family 1 protein [Anabaena sp. UHCC 0253]|uniref:glycosyltransferase family 1 protein n=1 Tax=Anabaena sp. UHCC 0253 TaxID=2590019 RepID=UPI0014464031|nr:glycosyltransferase family 1 protein [Anabaena sp. UHCC 0253]MTJ52794.1 glycosyltransferase family 1 protein [Anabaena sp. UHCC 0253]